MTNYTLKEFTNIFKKLNKQNDTTTVFNDWLSYCMNKYMTTDIQEKDNLKKYSKEEQQHLETLYNYWKNYTRQEIQKHGWFDFFGISYEEYIVNQFKIGEKGQFFTPNNITKLLRQLTLKEDSKTIYDCSCGSGRILLSASQNKPSAILYGDDIDKTAIQMSILNLIIHKKQGRINWKDTLENKTHTTYIIKDNKITIKQ